MEKHAAGENIVSYCTKCKLMLDHAVVAVAGEEIAKVKCKTCGSAHKHRDTVPVTKARTPRVKKEGSAKMSVEARWEAGIAEAKGKERTYSMAAKYRVGDVVLHDHFGKGVVLNLRMNKCDMLFKDKERLMASGN
ncbi:MAG: hypothetical protein A2X56_04825 [Nitrospirae bacterium GWC2_57_13]|jgi:DNA-directed RNA polymerase subunit M/transcription elongation factor TFIIS|nr:MAG: hypothetical protein A2072_00290 [Nitrospirae bacterium GWC1_57_7]OGW27213.1 MAG: hypothetical protein A2X56_04825 [Nitrospirae bacterium GWC2_57_13]OGW45797.1 MAG: hypothetical protein A2X57_06930 [Nitrospirae bacterium GWD2_57_8]